MIESSVELVLALNRCLFFVSPNLARILFGSRYFDTDYRVWLWMLPPTAWGLWYFVRGTPAIFTSIYHIETWNPHCGYDDDMFKNVSSSSSVGNIVPRSTFQSFQIYVYFLSFICLTITIFNNLQYNFAMFNAHQILIAASLPIIYGTFGLILFTKYTSQSALSSSNRTYAEKMVGIKNIAVDT